jgi:hypothetical protein
MGFGGLTDEVSLYLENRACVDAQTKHGKTIVYITAS